LFGVKSNKRREKKEVEKSGMWVKSQVDLCASKNTKVASKQITLEQLQAKRAVSVDYTGKLVKPVLGFYPDKLN
jgi:hypothetical protein